MGEVDKLRVALETFCSTRTDDLTTDNIPGMLVLQVNSKLLQRTIPRILHVLLAFMIKLNFATWWRLTLQDHFSDQSMEENAPGGEIYFFIEATYISFSSTCKKLFWIFFNILRVVRCRSFELMLKETSNKTYIFLKKYLFR